MTDEQQRQEVSNMLEEVVDRWCPSAFDDEGFQIRSMRALLNLAAFTKDCDRICKNDQAPIRWEYPVHLPTYDPNRVPK